MKGPDLVNIWEVPEIIQKVLESMRTHELAILERLETQKYHETLLNKQEHPKHLLFVLPRTQIITSEQAVIPRNTNTHF